MLTPLVGNPTPFMGVMKANQKRVNVSKASNIIQCLKDTLTLKPLLTS